MNNRINITKKFANKIKSDDIEQIILFGSVARGEDKEDSDIDILIVSPNKNKVADKISEEVANVILNNQEVISAHIISKDRFDKTQHFSFIKCSRRRCYFKEEKLELSNHFKKRAKLRGIS